MIYIVLGMHKSGTTLIAEILHKSGINMGEFDEKLGYYQGNKYERKEVYDINNRLLGYREKAFSLDVINVVDDVNRLDKNTKTDIENLSRSLNEKFKDWGFKDPKTCLTYKVWKHFIPQHGVIVVFRHPLEMWLHYNKNNVTTLLRCWSAVRAWYIYNREILECLRLSPKNCLVTEYGEFMTQDKSFDALCGFTNKKLLDCREKDMYRKKKKTVPLFDLIVFLQKILRGRDVDKLYREFKNYCNA